MTRSFISFSSVLVVVFNGWFNSLLVVVHVSSCFLYFVAKFLTHLPLHLMLWMPGMGTHGWVVEILPAMGVVPGGYSGILVTGMCE